MTRLHGLAGGLLDHQQEHVLPCTLDVELVRREEEARHCLDCIGLRRRWQLAHLQ